MMTINAKNEALSVEQLDAVSGGSMQLLLQKYGSVLDMAKAQQQQAGPESRQPASQNDPAQMFKQIMQQLTQG